MNLQNVEHINDLTLVRKYIIFTNQYTLKANKNGRNLKQ